MAWDTMALLMAGYESSEKESAFIDITEYTRQRKLGDSEIPNPAALEKVYQEI